MTDMTTTNPSHLLQIAVDQNADIDKLEKLMELQMRWQADQAKKAYVVAMANFRADCPVITKNRDAHNSKYADLAHTLKLVQGLLSQNGLSHTWKTEQNENQLITVTCCVTHEQGHQECTSMSANPDDTGSKNSVQAIGSTTTYLQRYTLFAILGLASTDQDNDGNAIQETISAKDMANLEALFEEVGGDKSKFLQNFKVESFEDIPAAQVPRAFKMLENKRASK